MMARASDLTEPQHAGRGIVLPSEARLLLSGLDARLIEFHGHACLPFRFFNTCEVPTAPCGDSPGIGQIAAIFAQGQIASTAIAPAPCPIAVVAMSCRAGTGRQ